MGNYGNIPMRRPVEFKPKLHQFESSFVQRVKETPFINADVYSLNPPIFMDNAETTLGQLIAPRLNTHQFFPPEQILKIIQNVVSGLIELEDHGFSAHGDLSFDTIFYDKKFKNFRVVHPVFCPESGYELTKEGKRFSFLSPQQLLMLTCQQQSEGNETSFKSDLFVLGIIMCEVCTLTSSSNIYCPDTYNIFDLEIQNRMMLIKQYYSNDQAYSTIMRWMRGLLEYDEDNRKSCQEMLKQNRSSRNGQKSSIASRQGMAENDFNLEGSNLRTSKGFYANR